MSLMKKLARIIKEDVMKKSAKNENYDEEQGNYLDGKNDYVYAAAYKSEQESIWKQLYQYIASLSLVFQRPNEDGSSGGDALLELKQSIHNYVEDEGNSVGSRFQHPSSAFSTFSGNINRSGKSKEIGEVSIVEIQKINELINQIDWT